MLVLIAAAALLHGQSGPISVRTRILRLNADAEVSGKGFDVVHKSPANFGVGLELAVNGIVDGLLKDHKAQMVYDQSQKAMMGERMLWSFRKERDDERVEVMPSATSDGHNLDLTWNYAGRGGLLSHRFTLPKGNGGIIVVRVGNSRLLMAINLADAG